MVRSFHGKTANGDIFDKYSLTAAHNRCHCQYGKSLQFRKRQRAGINGE